MDFIVGMIFLTVKDEKGYQSLMTILLASGLSQTYHDPIKGAHLKNLFHHEENHKY